MPGPEFHTLSSRPTHYFRNPSLPPTYVRASLPEHKSQGQSLESWSRSRLDRLADVGEWYGGVRSSLRKFTSDSVLRSLGTTKDGYDVSPYGTSKIFAPLSKAFDAMTGVGSSLEVFSKEHRAGEHDYSKTMLSIVRTTGEVSLSSALGVSAASATAALLGGTALPVMAGIGVGVAGYALIRSGFDYVQSLW